MDPTSHAILVGRIVQSLCVRLSPRSSAYQTNSSTNGSTKTRTACDGSDPEPEEGSSSRPTQHLALGAASLRVISSKIVAHDCRWSCWLSIRHARQSKHNSQST